MSAVTTLAAATDPNQTVMSGALLVALPIALLGGLVSFFSRACCRSSPVTSPT